jgi:hypothetical protein
MLEMRCVISSSYSRGRSSAPRIKYASSVMLFDVQEIEKGCVTGVCMWLLGCI